MRQQAEPWATSLRLCSLRPSLELRSSGPSGLVPRSLDSRNQRTHRRRACLRLPGGGRMSGKLFLKRLYQEYENDGVADSAAALSYYFIFSLFPFLFFLSTLTAYVPGVKASVATALDRAR